MTESKVVEKGTCGTSERRAKKFFNGRVSAEGNMVRKRLRGEKPAKVFHERATATSGSNGP